MVKRKDACEDEVAAEQTPAQALDRFAGDPDFMLSLARGLLVLRAFEREPVLSVSRAAALTGLPRAAARRCLYTLEQLGYIGGGDGEWRLRPMLLTLAQAYLTSTSFAEAAQPYLTRLRDTVGESCSIGVFDGDEVAYIARAETKRIISIALHVGSRVPAYCTSMGRVLLAQLDPAALDRYLAAAPFPARTPHTRVTAADLRAELATVAASGYALIDQEMEIGLRSIAVPIRDASGRVVAALNVGAAAAHLERDALVESVLPVLRDIAGELTELAVLAPGIVARDPAQRTR